MNANNGATRFFDTTGCLNLSRPTSGTRLGSSKQQKRPNTSSVPIRGQTKIDLYNFDHIDFANSKYVLTSPRSLEACARLNIKPATLLPKKLSDIKSDKLKFSTLVDIRDEMELERLAKLQLCRDEREKIIREETVSKTDPFDSKSSSRIHDASIPRKTHPRIHRASTSKTVPVHFETTNTNKSPKKPTSSTNPVGINSTVSSDELKRPTSANLLDDVRRMDRNVQRIGTTKPDKNEYYVHGLENVKHMIEQRITQTKSANEIDNLTYEKKQCDMLISHYDHELKIQKARENARRAEREKESERYDSLMHDVLDQTMADERRKNELRRRIDKLHQSRQLYEALQAKNHEVQQADHQRRRLDLLHEIKRKDVRTDNFVKEKQDTANLSRAIAKSSQDTREYIRETKENFDQKAKRAELTSSILVTKPKFSSDRRYLQSSIRT